MAPTAGLLYALSRPTHPDLNDNVFNSWYSNEHVHDMVKSGVTDLTVRYRNTKNSSVWPYLAIYRLPDVAKLQDAKVMGGVPATSSLLPGKTRGSTGGAYRDVIAMETRVYVRTQTFEGHSTKPGRGSGLATAAIQPANGTDADLDDWYRRQHLDMLR